METVTENKLDPEFKKRWVEALRSGEYKQGKFALINENNETCCLGVAALLCGAPIDLILNKPFVGDLTASHADFSDYPEILKWKRSGCLATRLSVMNDDVDGKSFEEIADYIEENL